jgi:hypothetical protein
MIARNPESNQHRARRKKLAQLEIVLLALRQRRVPRAWLTPIPVAEDPDSCLAQVDALISEMPDQRCQHLARRPAQAWWTSLEHPIAHCARCRFKDPVFRAAVGACSCCGTPTQFTAEKRNPDNLGTGALWRCLACGDMGYKARRRLAVAR